VVNTLLYALDDSAEWLSHAHFCMEGEQDNEASKMIIAWARMKRIIRAAKGETDGAFPGEPGSLVPARTRGENK